VDSRHTSVSASERLKHTLSFLLIATLALTVAGTTVWAVLALYFVEGAVFALAYCLIGLMVLVGTFLPRWRMRVLVAYGGIFIGLLFWWGSIEPSNHRDWQPSVAVLPYATIQGSQVTVHNIRNFAYRSETDFEVAYYDKVYDLDELESADLVASYWMGPAIAHIFISFGFGGNDYLAISIETRPETGEAYSSIKGFFKQYELHYVVADERDVIRLRTNYRNNPPEQSYLYRLQVPVENVRQLFLEYLATLNALKHQPRWYNTLTTNCTTAIWMHSRVNPQHLPLSWKILASGYVPEYLYEMGRLGDSLPFAELQQAAHINARAQAADRAVDFSRLIRTLPPPAISPN
jgi:drug/metabolite transporter superfamily protein YnfA